MLPRTKKLTRQNFPSFREQKRQWTGSVLKVSCYLRKEGQKGEYFAVLSGKKFSKSAVVRNRLKRQVFGILTERQAFFTSLPYGRYVLAIKPASPTPTFTQIKIELKQWLSELT